MTMSIFKEFSNLITFFKLPKEKKSIVFYAEHGGYFAYLEGVVKALTEDHKTPICYVTSYPSDPILQTTNPLITPLFFKKLLPWFMMLVNTKVFVMTLTDLHQFHLRRSINPVHYVYMFHALVSTHMMYREGALDHYDTILCCGPHHIEEIRKREKNLNLKKKNLVNGGYYRLEKICEQWGKITPARLASQEKTILIAPSWGEHNIVKTCGKKLIRNILANAEYNLILRPHPETVRQESALLKEYEEEFGNNPRFTLETSVATNTSMLKADLLITDLSGIALEYAFGTERPVLFVDLPYKIKNPNYKELGIEPLEISIRSEIGKIISPEEIDNVYEHIKNSLHNEALRQQKTALLRKKWVFELGNSSEIAAKTIKELYEKDVPA